MDRQEFSIQEYSQKYREQVIRLILSIQQKEFNIPITLEQQPDLAYITCFYQKGKGNFWVALHGELVIGTIALLDIGNHQGVLKKLFVDRFYRGKKRGIALSLFQTVKQWAKNKYMREIYLGTTHVFLAAHRFYEKIGFSEISKDCIPSNFPFMKIDQKFYKYLIL